MHDISLWSLWHARHRRGPSEADGLGRFLKRLIERWLLAVGPIPRGMRQGGLPEVRHPLWVRL